jgi:hypothetical protein
MTTPDDLEVQMEIALDALRAAVVRLLRDGEVSSQLAILALARVTGEVGAAAALASEQDPEGLLCELAGIMRQTGREMHEMLLAEALPTAGSA